MSLEKHWNGLYERKEGSARSWTRAHLETSLALIAHAGLARGVPVLDVGGGESTLVDDLLAEGYSDVTVLDLSSEALAHTRERLGIAGEQVGWIAGDITKVALPARRFGIWHDRAVFHFLLHADDRAAYLRQVRHAVMKGGQVILGTFAADGPARCSGLEVRRYTAEELGQEFSEGFRLVEAAEEKHITPSGSTQPFIYCRWVVG